MARREYKPGSRNQRYRKFHRGQYVDERMAWLHTILGQFVLMYYPEGTEIAESTIEPGPTVKVLIPRHNAPTIHWDLTALTVAELAKMREFFTLIFDTAEPIVAMRDEVAANAVAEGNDSIARIYRQLPQLVVRERKEPEHSESVQCGPEDVSESGDERGSLSSSAGRVRGHGGVLADEGTSDGSRQDDGEEAD